MAEKYVGIPKNSICLSMRVSHIIIHEFWNLVSQKRVLFLETVVLVLVWAAALGQLWQFSHCYLPEDTSWQRRGHPPRDRSRVLGEPLP